MSEHRCENCGKVFESEDDFEAMFARNQHHSYCILPIKFKILRVLLAPLAFVGIPVAILLMPIYAVVVILGYPFVFAIDLVFEHRVDNWNEYVQWAGLEDKNRIVRVRKP